MTVLFSAVIEAVGAEAAELFDAGVVILFASGVPAELAEVSVTHDLLQAAGDAPVPGDRLRIGDDDFAITAVGETAWFKATDIGHVVFSFTGAATATRPGEICVAAAPEGRLAAILAPGTTIAILRAGASSGGRAA